MFLWGFFSITLQWLWWRETWGTHAVSRCPIPPDYLCANNATASAKRYSSYVCITTVQESRESLNGCSTRTAPLSVVIRAECWKEAFHISYLCSCCRYVAVRIRETRPWWWEGCTSFACPSSVACCCISSISAFTRKGGGPPKDLAQHTAVMFNGRSVTAGRSFHWCPN